ncbi:MAG: TIGR02466 family protein [Synechococcaceae cyanobacterium]|nr:TIGR02466 family protein [Synechococcaceae cyanobacterium]
MVEASGLRIQPLFPVALAEAQLACDPLAMARRLQVIHQLRGTAASNPDPACAWTGDLNGVWRLHRHPDFTPLITTIAGHARAYLQAVGFDPARVMLHIQRCWPVVSEAGQVVGRHHHPNAHLSAVHYLSGDGSGRTGCLRIWPHQPPNELVPGLAAGHGGPIDPAHPLNQPWIDVAPRAGLLLLFPAGLDHAVLENHDEDDLRVSISVDFVLTAPPVPAACEPSEYLAPHPGEWDPVGEGGAIGEDGRA